MGVALYLNKFTKPNIKSLVKAEKKKQTNLTCAQPEWINAALSNKLTLVFPSVTTRFYVYF